MRRALLTLVMTILLAACQLTLPGRGQPDAAVTAPADDAITTTTLDDAPPAAPAAESLSATETTPPAVADAPAEEPASEAAAAADAASPTDAAAEPAPPVEVKTPAQIACEEDGGTWARAGDGGGMACVRTTRDSGKQCSSKSDCQGECLARSRTCAPVQPLFGCNAVLMDNGAEVNLCID